MSANKIPAGAVKISAGRKILTSHFKLNILFIKPGIRILERKPQ